MSFSRTTKDELAHIDIDTLKDHCKLAEMAGFLRMCGRLEIAGGGRFTIIMPAETPAIARHFKMLVKAYFDVDPELVVEETGGLKKGSTYNLRIDSDRKSEAMLLETGIMMIKGGSNHFTDGISESLIKNKCCRKAYLRGAFMGSGTITDPEKGYHLEINCTNEATANDLKKLIKTFTDIYPKVRQRKNIWSVYLKGGGQILDMLAIMGAHSQYLAYDNVMMIKDVRNKANRASNCDSANVDKMIKASAVQTDAIGKIIEAGKMEQLPYELQEVAYLRMDHPDSSYEDIGKMMDPPLGRSGVSKRFKKLVEVAGELNGKR